MVLYYNIALFYNLMGPSSYMRSVIDRNVVRWSISVLRTKSFGAQRKMPRCSGCSGQLNLPSLSDVSCLTGLPLTHSHHNLHCVRSSIVELQRHICSLLPTVIADEQRVPIINTYTHCPAHSKTDTELSSQDQFKSAIQWRLRDRPIADSMQLRPATNRV